MKKLLLISALLSFGSMAYSSDYNISVKTGVDVWSKYDSANMLGQDMYNGDSDGLGFEFALEGTKNITSNLELGIGLAYQRHSDLDKNSFEDTGMKAEVSVDRYDSIPLYIVSKYNFDTFENGIKPYLKANLGYSFNLDKGNLNLNIDGSSTNTDMKMDNGVYFGIGGGIEYQNFFVDLMYQITTAKVKYKIQEPTEIEHYKKDMDYSRVTLGFGYKFTY